MTPVDPKGSSGYRMGLHPVPPEYTDEHLESIAARVPAPVVPSGTLDKAADSVIAEITGK